MCCQDTPGMSVIADKNLTHQDVSKHCGCLDAMTSEKSPFPPQEQARPGASFWTKKTPSSFKAPTLGPQWWKLTPGCRIPKVLFVKIPQHFKILSAEATENLSVPMVWSSCLTNGHTLRAAPNDLDPVLPYPCQWQSPPPRSNWCLFLHTGVGYARPPPGCLSHLQSHRIQTSTPSPRKSNFDIAHPSPPGRTYFLHQKRRHWNVHSNWPRCHSLLLNLHFFWKITEWSEFLSRPV